MKTNKILFVVMAFVMLITTCFGAFTIDVNAADNVFVVSTADDVKNAFTEIGSNDSGSFVIELANDIELNYSLGLAKQVEVTILGNGYTLSKVGHIYISAGKINLGDSTGNELTITGTNDNDEPGIFYVNGVNSQLTMNTGVTLKDARGNNYYGGAVSVNRGIFHMYGGTIQNCGILGGSNCFGGGVGIINGGQFIMDDGLIKDCYVKSDYSTNNGWKVTNCTGGGVFLSSGASFTMNGGIIDNCYASGTNGTNKSAIGGGISAVTSVDAYYDNGNFGYLDSSININGGTIKNCYADIGGGGIFAGGFYLQCPYFGPVDTSVAPNPNTYGLHINGGEFINNSANQYGGAVFANMIRPSIGVEVKNATFIENSASLGGGLLFYDRWTSPIIDNINVQKNHADNGGGLCAATGSEENKETIIITNSIIANNIADEEGSDIYVQGFIDLSLNDISQKNVTYLGSPSDLTNSTIDGWYEDYDVDDGNVVLHRFVNQTSDERTLEPNYSNLVLSDSSEYIALIAAANANYVTVSYDAMGIGIAPETQQILKDTNTTAPTNAEWQDGYIITTTNGKNYVFGGWYTDDTLATPFDFNTTISNDITVYAKWTYTDYITSININKTYLIKDGYENAGNQIDTTNKIVEQINFNITPYKSFNREDGKTDMPIFTNPSTISIGQGNDFASIDLPNFNGYGVGEYWYELEEIAGNTTGVKYDTNKYYMHIVVSYENDLNYVDYGISQVTLHKTAPSDDGSYVNAVNDKVTGFTNEFASGSFSIKKEVFGNLTDLDKYYEITIELIAPENTIVNTNIEYNGGFNLDNTAITNIVIEKGWSGTKTITLLLDKDAQVTFKNVPDTIKYKIIEKDYSIEGYENPTFIITNNESNDVISSGDTWVENSISGFISNDIDEIVIQNTKNVVIDIGVVTDNAPFIILIICSSIFGIVLLFANKKKLYY